MGSDPDPKQSAPLVLPLGLVLVLAGTHARRRDPGLDHQAMPVLPQHVAQIAERGLPPRPFTVQPGLRIGRGGMRGVAPRFEERSVGTIKALIGPPSGDSDDSDRFCLSDASPARGPLTTVRMQCLDIAQVAANVWRHNATPSTFTYN